MFTKNKFTFLILFIIFVVLVLAGLWPFFLILCLIYFGAKALKNKRFMAYFDKIKGRIKTSDLNTKDMFQQIPSGRKIIKIIIYVVAGIAFLFIVLDCFVSVPAGHVAVLYDRGRGVLSQSLPEGLHLKLPFWQIATLMDTRLQAFTMTVVEEERLGYGSGPIEALTSDGQKVYIDATVQFRVAGQDAPKIYKTIGLDYMTKVVMPGVRSVVREVITGYDSTKLFAEEARTEAAQKMAERLRADYGRSSIQLDNFLLRNVQFSDTYLKAIEEKQVAQQKIQKAEYEKLEAVQLKQKKIIEAEGEARAIQLKAETLKTNPQVIQWEFVQKMAPNINWGILPEGALPLLDLKQLQR